MKKTKRPRSAAGMEPIDAVLRQVFSHGKFGKSIQVAEVEMCWREIVGEDIALHCAPEKINNGKLYIAVDSPVWHQQIDLAKEQLIMEMTHRLQHLNIAKIICRTTPA
jgi:predicted nucleic acid-binding Zn ribbon protein